MENLENALKFYDQEIELHTEKLLKLKEILEKLTPQAHELSVEYATTNANDIAMKSMQVGKDIADLEREINKLNNYIQTLWNSKMNLKQIISEEEQNNKTR